MTLRDDVYGKLTSEDRFKLDQILASYEELAKHILLFGDGAWHESDGDYEITFAAIGAALDDFLEKQEMMALLQGVQPDDPKLFLVAIASTLAAQIIRDAHSKPISE